MFSITRISAQQISVAEECRVKTDSGLSFVSHRVPTRFNVRVGAYYYWRVIFAGVLSDEYYSRNSGNHTFELKQVPSPSVDFTPYRVQIQRRLYSWEEWTDYSSDINRYFVDDMPPDLAVLTEPRQGTTVGGNAVFKWDFTDIGCGLHIVSPYHMVLKDSGGGVVYDSGWMNGLTYTSPAGLDVGSYSWTVSARDNDENITTKGPNYFKVGTVDQPQIYKVETRNLLGEEKGATNSRNIYVLMGAFDEYKIAAYHISESPAFPAKNDANWKYISPSKSFEDSVHFELSPGDGSKNIYVCFKGVSGNLSDIKNRIVVFDSVPPYSASAKINDDAVYTAKKNVSVEITAADNVGVYSYTIRESPDVPVPNDFGWLKFSDDISVSVSKKVEYTLSPEESLKTLYVWVRDAAGNITAAEPKTIRYTLHPPLEAVTGRLSLKGGYSLVNTREVTLELSAAGSKTLDVTGYYLAEYPLGTTVSKPSPDDAGWKAITPAPGFNAQVAFTLSSYDGTHEIYAWYKDAVGSVSDPARCLVAFDTLRPSGSVSVKNVRSGDWVNSEVVTLHLSASDSQGISGFLTSSRPENPSSFDSRWMDVPLNRSFSDEISYSLGSVNEEKKIYVFYKDGAGNVSESAVTKVMLDTVPPTAGTEEATVVTVAGSYTGTSEGDYRDGQGTSAALGKVASVDVDAAGNIYVADSNNYRIRKISGPDYIVSTFAGNGEEVGDHNTVNGISNPSRNDGPLLTSAVGNASKVSIDRTGAIFCSTYHAIRKIANGRIKKVFGNSDENKRMLLRSEGPALEIYVVNLSSMTCDSKGDLFVSTASENLILKADMKRSYSTIYAGVKNSQNDKGIKDGYRTDTPIGFVSDMCVDECDNLYFVSGNNYLIKKIGADGYIKTLAGRSGSDKFTASLLSTEGYGDNAFFNVPYGICADHFGNIYVTEMGGCCVRKITPNGYASILAGKGYAIDGEKGDMDGVGRDATFEGLQGITIDASGTLYAASYSKHKIKRIAVAQTAYLEAAPAVNGEVAVKIFTTDNFSGVRSFMVSEDPVPPVYGSSGWTGFRERSGAFLYTEEVKIKLRDPARASTIYAWYMDKAGNISSASSIEVNKKNMKSAGIIGSSSNMSAPYTLTVTKDEDVLFADKSDPPIGRVGVDGSIARLGALQDQANRLSSEISGIASFKEGFFGVLEKNKSRFSVFDPTGKFVNYFASSIDIFSNFHAQSEDALLRKKIIDKYMDPYFKDYDVKALANQDGITFPDANFTASTMEVFSDPACTVPLPEVVSMASEPEIFVKVKGCGTSSENLNSIILEISSTDDPAGLSVPLIETTPSSNEFRGKFRLGKYTVRSEGRIGVSIKKRVALKLYSRNGLRSLSFAVDGSWKTLGKRGEGSDCPVEEISMAISGSGVIYTAFRDLNAAGKVSVRSFEKGKWQNVGIQGFSLPAKEIRIFVYQEIPFVAFAEDMPDGSGKRLSVMFHSGGAWSYLGQQGFSKGDPSYISLCVYNGVVYVACSDSGDRYRAMVKKYDGRNWVNVGPTGFTDPDVTYLNVKVHADIVYLAYKNYYSRIYMQGEEALYNDRAMAKVKRFVKNSWEDVASDSICPDQIEDISLSISDGVLYLAFRNNKEKGGVTALAEGYLEVKSFDGTKWNSIGEEHITHAFHYISIDVENATPYVSYVRRQDQIESPGNIHVLTYDQGNWVDVGQEEISDSGVLFPVVKVFNGSVYIAYRDEGDTDRLTVKKFEW